MLWPIMMKSRPASRQKKTATGARRNEGPCWMLRWKEGQVETLWWWANCSRVSRTWTHIRYITITASRHSPDRHRDNCYHLDSSFLFQNITLFNDKSFWCFLCIASMKYMTIKMLLRDTHSSKILILYSFPEHKIFAKNVYALKTHTLDLICQRLFCNIPYIEHTLRQMLAHKFSLCQHQAIHLIYGQRQQSHSNGLAAMRFYFEGAWISWDWGYWLWVMG